MSDWLPAGGSDLQERERLLEALDSYRRGLNAAPLLRKWSGAPARNLNGGPAAAAGGAAGREGAGDSSAMTFVVSSEEVDRHGDVVAAQGWHLTAYRQNPVFLWAHDYTRPVIGRARSLWVEPGQLLAGMEFAPTDFAREVAALYRSGYQQGVSVGFKPLRYEERRQEGTGAFLGLRFLEQELLEVSAVPVPANRQALRRAWPPTPCSGGCLYRMAEGDRPADSGRWPATPAGAAAEPAPPPGAAGLLAELLITLRAARSQGG